ncbi:MAG: sensor histidine kinase [Parvibaculaceae bacterium]
MFDWNLVQALRRKIDAAAQTPGSPLLIPIWESEEAIPWQRDLLTIFVRNQLRVSLALPLIALLLSAASLLWTEPANAVAWFGCMLACQGVQLWICRHYEQSDKDASRLGEWIGMLAASEFLYAACWSLPLYTIWEQGNSLQHIFLITTLMAVAAVRIMIASNFMPIVVAGTGFITFNIMVRCILEAQPLYVVLGGMAFVVELFFLQLSRRLQETARDMLIFKAQREKLIEELKRARDQAEAARERAEEASRSKSRFLATMSHELRTPLNAIMGFSEILSQEMMGPHAVTVYKDYADDIHRSGHYLLALINDILDLSRIEAGRHEIQDEPVSLVKIGRDCAKLLAIRARQKRQTVREVLPDEVPMIRGDERSVRQIWLNLIGNAIKFTPERGEIVLSVASLPDGAVALSVRDNGPGIPQHEIEVAMGAFSRGSMATRKAIDGAGLGLPIVQGLSKLYGAEMRIRSKPAWGTEVTVTFPPRRVILVAPTAPQVEAATSSQKRLIALTA